MTVGIHLVYTTQYPTSLRKNSRNLLFSPSENSQTDHISKFRPWFLLKRFHFSSSSSKRQSKFLTNVSPGSREFFHPRSLPLLFFPRRSPDFPSRHLGHLRNSSFELPSVVLRSLHDGREGEQLGDNPKLLEPKRHPTKCSHDRNILRRHTYVCINHPRYIYYG